MGQSKQGANWIFQPLLMIVLLPVAASQLLGAVEDKSKEKLPSVFTHLALAQEIFEILVYPARVEPKVHAAVLADADGVVTAIHAPLGTRVRAHQPLVTVQNIDPAYRYAPMTVLSPLSGIVGHVDVTVGSRVSRGDKLFLVTDPKQVRVTIEVASHDLEFVTAGLMGELKIADSDLPARLRVKGVSPYVDPMTGTAACEIEILSTPAGFRMTPGLIGRASFKANVHRGIVLAESAITYRGKTPFVRIVTTGISHHVQVSLGHKQSGFVEILKGVKPGDDVIERSSGFVADGERVLAEKAPAGEG